MRKIGIPAVRLMLAGRVLQRLSIADNGVALARVSGYIRAHPEPFGLRLPETSAALESGDFADYVIARSGALGECAYDEQIKVGLSAYFASLLGNDERRVNALLHLALASLDPVVRDLATVAVLGEPANRSVYAVPYEGLALLMDGEEDGDDIRASVEILRTAEYVSTNVVQAVGLLVTTPATRDGRIVSEHPVCRTGDEETGYDVIEANAVKLHDRIVQALLGHADPEAVDFAPEFADKPADPEFRSVMDLLAAAANGGHHGIHAAYQARGPNDHASTIVEQVLARGRPAILVDDTEANGAIVGLIAAQMRARHAQLRRRAIPIVVMPDEWSLVSAQAFDGEMESGPPDGSGQATAQYDIDVMTAQKRLLYIAGPRTLTPVLWAVSDEVPITRSLLSLFSEIAPLPYDDVGARVIKIETMAQEHGIAVSAATARRIASYAPDPSEFAGAFRRAAIKGIEGDLESACRALVAGAGHGRSLPNAKPEKFDLRLVAAKVTYIDPVTGQVERDNTLDRVIGQFVAKKHRPIRVLLYGDPGTSKTTLGHYIAAEMGMEVTELKPSQVLGKWVGETEKAIAEEFRKARQQRKFLIIDEVDSFMSHRADARQAWERTTVNEMLTQLQAHPLPMACTTNFIDRIDRAALRRFPFRIEALPLNADRARIAWTSLLKLDLRDCPDADGLEGLTVADFALVAERMEILEITAPAYARAALAEERASRNDQGQRPIGFLSR